MKRLVDERERLRLQIEALQNQLVGIERAITLMNGGVDPAQPSSSNGRERARNVKDTVLGLLAEAGEAGLTVTKCVEMAQKRGSHLERGTVSSLLSRLKREGILDLKEGFYSVRKPSPKEGGQPIQAH
jgi:hypothetical protein